MSATETIEGAREFKGETDVTIAEGSDPWLQRDGSVVNLRPHLARLSPDPDCDCPGGVFAPTGNGPTDQGIERCDECQTHPGDLAAAEALAALIGPGVTVWYLPS